MSGKAGASSRTGIRQHWSLRQKCMVERPDVDRFIEAVALVYRDYGFALVPQDPDVSLVVEPLTSAHVETLCAAHIGDEA